MDTPTTHVMTIANSIIGVSILAMPYCFKQCGIILSILMLILSSIISRLACHFLLKSAIKARLKTFEFLAYHAFGPFGKFIIEIGMIGFLLGTCIAFFVVMGDLSPEIVSQMIGLKTTNTVRTSVLVILAVFCILPLGLLRNVDSLSGVCTATIGFYLCLVLKIMGESAPHILVGDWYNKVEFWRTEGALQCIPIFSMALFCQTQLFEIYQAIPNASLERMNNLIRIAVNICTSVYIFVGIFGYIALSNESFSGNVLMSFKPSFMTEIMKIGFVLSVAFSFPLIIFPCRASLFSLLYKPTYVLHDSGTNYIPEGKFRLLTVVIVSVSLLIGVLIPNIELVLGLVGSTIGVMICVLFPATCFICMSTKNTNERILAQLMLFIGIIVMVLGTYANIYAIEEANLNAVTEKVNAVPLDVNANIMKSIEEHKVPVLDIPDSVSGLAEKNSNINADGLEDQAVLKEVRHEPPQPVEPEEVVPAKPKEIPKVVAAPENVEDGKKNEVVLNGGGTREEKKETPKPAEEKNKIEVPSQASLRIPEVSDKIKETAEINRSEQVDIEAIKKEDKEIIQQEKEKDDRDLRDQISQLQKQNQVQQQIVQEQKKILEEIKQRQEALMSEQGQNEINKVKEEKLKAVKEIETIAKQAIKSLVEDGALENAVNAKPAVVNLDLNILKNDTNNKEAAAAEPDSDSVKINQNIGNTDAIKKSQELNKLSINQNVNINKTDVAADIAKQRLSADQSDVPRQVLNFSSQQQQDKIIKLENLIPIPIAKSNNISVFASVISGKPNASNDDNKQLPLVNENLKRKIVETLVPKSPEGLSNEQKANMKSGQNVIKTNETVDIDGKQKDEKSEKIESKQDDVQAMRRDILSKQVQEKREKRDVNELGTEICDKPDAVFDGNSEEKYENQYKSDDSIRSDGKTKTLKSPDDSVNHRDKKDKGEICEKAEVSSEEQKLFNGAGDAGGAKEAFNLNPDIVNTNQHDLSKNILESSFNVFKNRKK